MDSWKKDLKQYLPTVEEFLTSLLLEDTDIEIDSLSEVESEVAFQGLNDTDIFLFAHEQKSDSDVIVILDQEWLGLLSSIMLGIEEKEKNETTIGILEEFSSDLSDVIIQKAAENDLEIELDGAQVLSKSETQEQLAQKKYFWAQLDIEGIADDKVRAEFLMGDPKTPIEEDKEEPEQDSQEPKTVEDTEKNEEPEKVSEDEESSDSEDAFSPLNEEEEIEGRNEKVISARQIEFAEFSEDFAGQDGEMQSMDLLKDVELDVSVELGRIELPLGKVLQLSKGSVVELEKLAGEPVDILVNGNRIALGEVVVIDEHFGVRISSLVTTKKRLAKINNGS